MAIVHQDLLFGAPPSNVKCVCVQFPGIRSHMMAQIMDLHEEVLKL